MQGYNNSSSAVKMEPTKKITPQELIKAVVAANARVPLAVERLRRQGYDIQEADVLGLISSDQSTLGEQIRMSLILETYHTMMLTQVALVAKLDMISPSELGRTYTNMASSLAALTARPTEDAVQEPIDINAARGKLAERLDDYKKRMDEKAR